MVVFTRMVIWCAVQNYPHLLVPIHFYSKGNRVLKLQSGKNVTNKITGKKIKKSTRGSPNMNLIWRRVLSSTHNNMVFLKLLEKSKMNWYICMHPALISWASLAANCRTNSKDNL